jgi:hypothetical protein
MTDILISHPSPRIVSTADRSCPGGLGKPVEPPTRGFGALCTIPISYYYRDHHLIQYP